MENSESTYKSAYIPDRISCYPSISEQLDSLWHDIDSGLFGEVAKSGNFYLSVKDVKDRIPKSSEGDI